MELTKTALGIEFGSTRIKAVLVDFDGKVLASGSHEWENKLVNGVWTYDLADVDAGLRSCYASLRKDIEVKYGVTPETFGAIGISAMMHGYIALDKDDKQLAPFQTWRNTNTTQAADILTDLFQFNIPLRWSVAHLYQRALDGEAHVKDVAGVFTLAAYMHYKLTGEKVIGIGDAAGMFPIDSEKLDYDEGMVQKFNALLKEKGYEGVSCRRQRRKPHPRRSGTPRRDRHAEARHPALPSRRRRRNRHDRNKLRSPKNRQSLCRNVNLRDDRP